MTRFHKLPHQRGVYRVETAGRVGTLQASVQSSPDGVPIGRARGRARVRLEPSPCDWERPIRHFPPPSLGGETVVVPRRGPRRGVHALLVAQPPTSSVADGNRAADTGGPFCWVAESPQIRRKIGVARRICNTPNCREGKSFGRGQTGAAKNRRGCGHTPRYQRVAYLRRSVSVRLVSEMEPAE